MTLIKASTLAALRAERARQVQSWGEQNHPDGTGTYFDDTNARIARAACALAWVEAVDRRQRPDVESPAGPLLVAEEAS